MNKYKSIFFILLISFLGISFSAQNLPFFLTSEHFIGNKIADLNEFDEYPISLNDYTGAIEKCENWKCTAISASASNGVGMYCSGLWNCTKKSGNFCIQYNCTQ